MCVVSRGSNPGPFNPETLQLPQDQYYKRLLCCPRLSQQPGGDQRGEVPQAQAHQQLLPRLTGGRRSSGGNAIRIRKTVFFSRVLVFLSVVLYFS